jgi:hypothetical protein
VAHSRTSGIQRATRILDHLNVDRKKTVFAVALLAVMAFMWFRVLTGRKPDAATANPNPQAQQQDKQKPQRKVCFIRLPNVPGRNDYINRDFFAARDWECFRQNNLSQNSGTDTEVHVVSSNLAQEVISQIVKKLRLEAIVGSEPPQAFINDQVLGVGDRLTVRDGPETRELEVLRIYQDSVLMGCNGTKLTLKLAQDLEVSN